MNFSFIKFWLAAFSQNNQYLNINKEGGELRTLSANKGFK